MVRLKGTPALTLDGALMRNLLAAPGFTVMPASVPLRLAAVESVTVIDWVPAVFSVR